VRDAATHACVYTLSPTAAYVDGTLVGAIMCRLEAQVGVRAMQRDTIGVLT
jgi:hypothetical protein